MLTQFPKHIYRLPPLPPTILTRPRRSISYRQAADGTRRSILDDVKNIHKQLLFEGILGIGAVI